MFLLVTVLIVFGLFSIAAATGLLDRVWPIEAPAEDDRPDCLTPSRRAG